MRLSETDLKRIAPGSLLSDPDVKALFDAVSAELRLLGEATDDVKAAYSLDEANDAVLTHLAWMFNSDLFFIGSTREQKRELVRNVIALHRKKGTKWALEQGLAIINPSVTVEEWFEYGGLPYHFRLNGLTEGTLKQVSSTLLLIYTLKNLRSWLDGNFTATDETEIPALVNLYAGITRYTVLDVQARTAGSARTVFAAPSLRIITSNF